ncbi:MAG: Gfo/Idh/MocA family oxidoreductase [Acidobacteria bacterium]|nr:Gfo/Idh/MocA family oxidoreductase [Acidobacteriota bacterium]
MPEVSRRTLLTGSAAASLLAAAGPIRLPHKVRLGLIGLEGHPGEVLTPLADLPDVELVGLAHPDEPEARRMLRNPRLATARYYADYRQMLDREKPDVVGVCNNDGERAAAVLECVRRKMHVIAETPLPCEYSDFLAIKRAVAAQGVQLSMLLPMRFQPEYLALKQIVDSGEIGEVAQMSAQKSYKYQSWPAWKAKRSTYGSTMIWIGPHMVDLMRFTSGREIRQVASIESHIGHPEIGDAENSTGALFTLDNGGVATLHMDFLRPGPATSHGDDRLRLAGTKGVAEYQASTGVTVISDSRKPAVITSLPARRSLFTEFLESLYNQKAAPVSLSDVYRVSEIVIRAREAAINKTIVAL